MSLTRKLKFSLSDNEISYLIFLGVFIFGIWLRILPVAGKDFPINDGGMFFTMIRDLRQNGYFLPAFTSYNNLNIPYNYPPLAFYLAGQIADIFRTSDLIVLLWLPTIINILTIPAFALLANLFLKSKINTAVATFFYALTPLSIDWLIMGGGLTRGMGQLFLILTTYCAYNLFYHRSRRYLWLTIICGALVILSHPESALLALISAAILWLFSSRSKRTFLDVFYVCAGVSLLCSPWLFHGIQYQGIQPFINAMQTNGSSLLMWTSLFSFTFAQEAGLTILSVLGVIGLFIKIGQKDLLLPVWLSIPFFINPRSAARAAILPLVILATFSLLDVIIPAIKTIKFQDSRLRNFSGSILVAYFLFYMLFSAFILDLKLTNNRLSTADQKAMLWVSQNTPKDSKFLILSGETQLMRDPIQEWFPALAERRSQTTIQGLEWVWGKKFIDSILTFQELIACFRQNLACITDQAAQLQISFDHLYIKKLNGKNCGDIELCLDSRALIIDLKNSNNFKMVYEDDLTVIFEKPTP